MIKFAPLLLENRGDGRLVVVAEGLEVAVAEIEIELRSREDAMTLAEEIVGRWNSHEALVEALKELLTEYHELANRGLMTQRPSEHQYRGKVERSALQAITKAGIR